jgi:hypothetical protein
MANPTTNYGFVLPTSSDLVTDLPADFDIALQGVDTRLKALQPGTTLGDLAYSSATANTNTRLPIGTTGQVLAVSGGVPAWTTTADVTPLTTKGDLFTFTTVDARLAVGANNYFLQAASGEATGLKWGGTWTAYTPTVTAATGSITTSSASGRWIQIGKFAFAIVSATVTTNGTGGGTLIVSSPVDTTGTSTAIYRENAVTGGIGQVVTSGATFRLNTTANGYPAANGYNFLFGIGFEVN